MLTLPHNHSRLPHKHGTLRMRRLVPSYIVGALWLSYALQRYNQGDFSVKFGKGQEIAQKDHFSVRTERNASLKAICRMCAWKVELKDVTLSASTAGINTQSS